MRRLGWAIAVVACGSDEPRTDGLSFGPGETTLPPVESSGSGASSAAEGSSSAAATTADTSAGSTSASEATSDASTTTTGAGEPFMMFDSLREGGTLGTPVGGTFGPDGWTVTGNADRIYWALPRLAEGAVEFTVTNITIASLPLADHEIFAMYEGGFGIEHPIGYNPEFRVNNYKSMIRIYGQPEADRVGQQKIMWGMCPAGAPGYTEAGCPCANGFFEEPFGGDGNWDGSAQRLRVEWGGGTTRYLRNDALVLTIDWSASGMVFGPESLYVSLGTPRPEEVDSAAMPIGAVFSDVTVAGITGDVASCM